MDAEIDSHAAFFNYLTTLCDYLKVQITLKDLVGFKGRIDYRLSMILSRYPNHENEYCRSLKHNRQLFLKCVSMEKLIHRKCTHLQKAFCGTCYAGVREYIVPIMCRGFVIGFFCVGPYQAEQNLVIRRQRKMISDFTLDNNYIKVLNIGYSKLQKKLKYSCSLISDLFGIASHYISEAYSQNAPENNGIPDIKVNYRENMILDRILIHIHNNYCENLNVSVLADLCNCSISYINHIFKKKTGFNLKLYINMLRINKSKDLLINSDDNITAISAEIGFDNPGYFTSIFRRFLKISPKEYRIRHKSV